MLAKSRNLATLRRSLASLPQTLDQTYDRILTAIREEDRVYAMRILQWLTFSERPLTIEEVAEVAAIDIKGEPIFDRDEVLTDPLEALDICSSLITVTGSAEKEVDDFGRLADARILSLAHYSVQEYLVSDRIKLGPAKQYHMQEGESHEEITKGCIGYLTQFQGPITDAQFDISALAMYSAEFWLSHFRKAGSETENLCRLALIMFSTNNPAYHNWLRLCDPDLLEISEYPDLDRELDDMATPLYSAARSGLCKITELLLDQGADVNAQGGMFGDALAAAVYSRHTAVAKLLIDAGANINSTHESWGTPLYQAAQDGDEATVKLLIDAGADVNAPMSKYPDWDNALQAAIGTAGEATVKLLLEGGADCGLDERLKGPIHYAALRSNWCTPSLISILQQYGASIDAIDIENMTPLHYCARNSNQKAAKQLLGAGVPIDIGVRRKSWSWDGDTFSPVDHMDTVHLIPESIAVGLTPLHFAALIGNLTMTKFFLDHGADPNALSEYGETPLHLNQRTTLYGTQYKDEWKDMNLRVENCSDFFYQRKFDTDSSTVESACQSILDTLLEHPSISTAAQDYQGENLLHCIKYGEPESSTLVQKILSRGADPSCVNSSQKSPLHLAREAGDTASIVALLSTSSQAAWSERCLLDTFNDALWSANHEVIVAILETKEARALKLVAKKNEHGENLLHQLFRRQPIRIKMVQGLLDQGVDSSELDDFGVSPLARLIQNDPWYVNVYDICRLLLKTTGTESYVNCNGQSLGHLCAATPNFQIYMLEAFNDHGVDLARRDCAGRTVLHLAAISGWLTEESLEFLVNVIGIDANEEDAHGRTALQFTIEEASKDHGSDIIYPARWERTRDMLLNHHANHKS
jgi:ankyrin repeat protein